MFATVSHFQPSLVFSGKAGAYQSGSPYVTQHNITFFAFSIIIEGTTEKAMQFILPVKPIYNKNLGFIERRTYFWTLQRNSNKQVSINWHHLCHEKNYDVLFRAALYRHMLVLHKDVLFHSNSWFPALPPSIKLGWKWLPLSNTLAYNDMAKITAVKSFIVQIHECESLLMPTG